MVVDVDFHIIIELRLTITLMDPSNISEIDEDGICDYGHIENVLQVFEGRTCLYFSNNLFSVSCDLVPINKHFLIFFIKNYDLKKVWGFRTPKFAEK